MSEDNKSAQITPETKISKLLEEFPKLEEVLIRLAPAFAKLRNPVLRKTIAKVTSLQQAARIAGIPVGEIITELRKVAGLDSGSAVPMVEPSVDAIPEWVDDSKVVRTLDIRPILNAGEHPMKMVLDALNTLKPEQILVVIAPFAPVPIMDLARNKGYLFWARNISSAEVKTYFIQASY